MDPQLSSYIAVFFLTAGMIAVWIMLEIQGNPKKRNNIHSWTIIHRTLGYLFIFTYIGMSGFMIRKAGAYQQELSARAIIHIATGLCLAPAIGFKLLIVKRFKRFFAYLPVLGTFIFACAFVMNGLTAGYYFLHKPSITMESLSEMDDTLLDKRLGWRFLNQKCSKCHSLEKVLKANKSKEGWVKTVVRMAEKGAPHIQPFHAKQIILYLSSSHDADRSAVDTGPKAMTGEALVKMKCSACHDLGRVYEAKKDLAAWRKTVSRMIENAEETGELNFLTETETEAIIQFLTNRK